ncbi:class II aldolase/adducin family protein [Candidatus Sumerlaeota bacterium]|nr:class II aldolase/adducin family protein [Candidatus Sumerlaeota bacterium]
MRWRRNPTVCVILHRREDHVNLDGLRREVHYANIMLPRCALVTMHSGNASGYDPEAGRVLIKPSGFDYEQLQPEHLVEVTIDGKILTADLKPSVDLPHHLYIYRHRPDTRGIIHTHSPYATSFAALGRPIPVCLTAIADEFGGDIPCAPYVDNEGDHIGEAVVAAMGKSPAVLLGQHGVFAFGDSPRAALKAAVMVEDVARTVHLAMLMGEPGRLPPEEVGKWFSRYHERYGQRR